MDAAFASFGGRREVGSESKSVARLLCPPERAHEFEGWSEGHIAATCQVREASSPPKVLGALIGDSTTVTQHFRATCAKVVKQREGIANLDNAQCELVLQRRCFDVSKVSYILRLNGDRADLQALEEFYSALRGATEDALRGRLRDEGWVQATLGVDAGGLGLREASAVALAAFVASRTASRPLVMEMCRHMSDEELVDIDTCMAAYDERTGNAISKLLAEMPEGTRDGVVVLIEAAESSAQRRWLSWCSGEEQEPEERDDAPSVPVSQRPGTSGVAEVGSEDPEHPAASRLGGAPKLQRNLMRISDACAAQGLIARAQQCHDHDTLWRLRELSSPLCSHEWLWSISKHKGNTMTSSDFATAVRIRLGAGGSDEEVYVQTAVRLCLGRLVHMRSSVHAGPATGVTTRSET